MILPRPAVLLLIAPAVAMAQAPAPAGPKDAIRNGGFERTLQAPNLWSGVDKDGFLAGFRGFLPVLNESGNVAETPMPVGVAVGDLNGDGLPDILSSDPLGYIRIYFNSGSKEQPKFTHGELTTPWLASGEGDPPWTPPMLGGEQEVGGWNQRWAKRRQGVRASLADLTGSGKLDLVAGNYFGDIFVIRNSGSGQAPQFPQPPSVARAVIPTMKDPVRRWGNVFAPLMHDWDGDNKPDLLVGEGSYSANNIHLFINQGSAASPAFNEEKRQPLALGEGRQQLTPALADLNGDGKADLVVSDRRGRATGYLRPDNWKFGDTLAPSGFLGKAGGLTRDEGQALVLGSGISTLGTGDLNGDGLFDLVVGKSNGRIAWSANKGTKESPKFEAITDLTGEKPSPAAWQIPSQWDISTGTTRGNFFAYASAVTTQEDAGAQPVEGTRALKFGYAAPSNQRIPPPAIVFPGAKDFDRDSSVRGVDFLYRASAEDRGLNGPANFFVLRQLLQFDIGKTYKLSFRTKGNKVTGAACTIGWRAYKEIGEARVVRGERGAATRTVNAIADGAEQQVKFRPGASWSEVTGQYKIEFRKERDLNKEPKTSEAFIEIIFDLAAPDGFLYLDDLKLVPQG